MTINETRLLRVEVEILTKMAAQMMTERTGLRVPEGEIAKAVREAAQRQILAGACAGQGARN